MTARSKNAMRYSKMTKDEFWEEFGFLETETLEFKQQITKELDTIPAMAMTDGGVIVFGVSDKQRDIVGVEITQSVCDDMNNRIFDRFSIDVEMKILDIEGRKLLCVEVPVVKDRTITTKNGRLLRRYGGSNKPLVGDAMTSFFRERLGVPQEDESGELYIPMVFDLCKPIRLLGDHDDIMDIDPSIIAKAEMSKSEGIIVLRSDSSFPDSIVSYSACVSFLSSPTHDGHEYLSLDPEDTKSVPERNVWVLGKDAQNKNTEMRVKSVSQTITKSPGGNGSISELLLTLDSPEVIHRGYYEESEWNDLL